MTRHFLPALKNFTHLFDSYIEMVTGFSSSQLRILGFLAHEEDSVCQKDIEVMGLVSRAAVSTILDKMEASGLIERKANLKDARKKEIVLTAKGREVSDNVYKLLTETERQVFSVLSEEEKKTMIEIGNKLAMKLEELRC